MHTLSLLGHSFAWALLYSLGQGLLICIALYVLLKAFSSASSATRYRISYSAFTMLVLWFADTWASHYQRLKGITVFISEPNAGNRYSTPHPVHITQAAAGNNAMLQSLQTSIEPYVPLFIAGYCLGLAFMACRLLISLAKVREMKRQGNIAPSDTWVQFINEWQEKLGINRTVNLLISSRINIPVMAGIIKPVILLPVAALNNLTTAQVETILLHELAHIKRNDYLFNFIQVIVETVLFYNPFVWHISNIIRKERELCCDDVVVACSAQPLNYAKALTFLEESNIQYSLAQAASGHKNQLFNRIKRIMEMKKTNTAHSRTAILVAMLIVLLFSTAVFTFTPSFAQKVKKEITTDTTGTPKKVYKYKTVTIDENGRKKVVTKTSSKPMDGDAANADEDVKVSFKDGKPRSRSVVINDHSSGDSDDMSRIVKDIVIASKDVADAMAEVNIELSSVDWDGVRAEIHNALDEIDRELNGKMSKEISVEVRKELENAKKEMKDAQKEMKDAHREMKEAHREMAYAHAGHAKAESHMHADGNNYEKMLGDMEHDGLIDRSKKYRVEKDNGELLINGRLQPSSVYDKYHSYLKGENILIKGNNGALTITVND